LYLDTTQSWTSSQGEKSYGGQSDGDVTYNTVTKLFSTDIHAFRGMPTQLIRITDKKSGKAITFKYTNADMDSTGEDTYGWNYVSIDSKEKCRLLVIND
jgi:hypothetical protein